MMVNNTYHGMIDPKSVFHTYLQNAKIKKYNSYFQLISQVYQKILDHEPP